MGEVLNSSLGDGEGIKNCEDIWMFEYKAIMWSTRRSCTPEAARLKWR